MREIIYGLSKALLGHLGYFMSMIFVSAVNGGLGICGPTEKFTKTFYFLTMFWPIAQLFYLAPFYFKNKEKFKKQTGLIIGSLIPVLIFAYLCFDWWIHN